MAAIDDLPDRIELRKRGDSTGGGAEESILPQHSFARGCARLGRATAPRWVGGSLIPSGLASLPIRGLGNTLPVSLLLHHSQKQLHLLLFVGLSFVDHRELFAVLSLFFAGANVL